MHVRKIRQLFYAVHQWQNTRCLMWSPAVTLPNDDARNGAERRRGARRRSESVARSIYAGASEFKLLERLRRMRHGPERPQENGDGDPAVTDSQPSRREILLVKSPEFRTTAALEQTDG